MEGNATDRNQVSTTAITTATAVAVSAPVVTTVVSCPVVTVVTVAWLAVSSSVRLLWRSCPGSHEHRRWDVAPAAIITWPCTSVRLLTLGGASVGFSSSCEGGLYMDLWVLTASTRIGGS